MRKIIDFNNHWYYKSSFVETDIENEDLSFYSAIQLPHTNVEVPYNYFDDKIYQFVSCYKKELEFSEEFLEKRVFIDFEGVMSYCKLYVDGNFIGEHKGGYTPFSVELTDYVKANKKSILTIMVDSTERKDIPPFGGTIDFLTFGGIYREAQLRIVESNFIEDIFIKCMNPLIKEKSLEIDVTLNKETSEEYTIDFMLYKENVLEHSKTFNCKGKNNTIKIDGLSNISLWDIDNPHLYNIKITYKQKDECIDKIETLFGFRQAEFKDTGFYLNGKLLKLIGLNRHQSFPYVGYAMPKRVQENDAKLLKDYGLNVVRTSHYPHSVNFIKKCDEIGLLVFEEIPGWQYIGDDIWKKQVLSDVESMIKRDRNNPSVILWGVRINESGDCHDLYAATNKLARELDPTRQTGGVRFLMDSEFLEDVYTMNDFIYDGGVKAYLKENVKNFSTYDDTPDIDGAVTVLRTQNRVTGLGKDVPYLVTEYCGHMFPTKITDNEEKLNEHALRHAKVLDEMFGSPNISGAIGWCAFDYNTHRDFGSGDKICYHGVMDMFRVPKYAANVYKSQKSPLVEPILEPATLWARGERCISGVMPLTIYTNCDYIKFYYGSELFGTYYPNKEKFPNLPHAPIVINEAIGFWGSEWEEAHFEGYIDGKKVVEKTFSENVSAEKLEITVDDYLLNSDSYDSTRVIVKIADKFGNPLPYSKEIVSVEVEGVGELIGPNLLPFSAGYCGFWVKTKGTSGEIKIKIKSNSLGTYEEIIKVD